MRIVRRSIGEVEDLRFVMDKKKYPIGPEHYTLLEEVGQGVSASVHRALCVPLDEVVAIKILDFERDNCDLNNISREAQTMVLVDHPNVLKSHCSFVSDHNLWVVMPFMAGGSCLHILKAAYPDGFEEVVIATILREAGNILIDARGAIKLGDFGVSACLFDSGDRQRTRNTFVGTPCWMAPEVMEQLHGYDFKADIWSFGITALELAHGHAPFSKYPPMKVLLMTLQNAPPGLDYERDNKFSKMIASCLVKDPSKRPSAKKLLKHSFFKQARSNDYIARKLLEGLPALGDRLEALKRKEEDMLAQKKIPDGQKEEMSQNEYKRGISGWNFNLEDVKAQASLIQDEDTIPEKDQGESSIISSGLDHGKQYQRQFSFLSYSSQVSDAEDNDLMQTMTTQSSACLNQITILFLFPRAKYEKSDDDAIDTTSSHDFQVSQNSSPRFEDNAENNLAGKPGLGVSGRTFDAMAVQVHQRRGGSSGSIILPDSCFLSSKGESDKLQNQLQNISSSSGFGAPQVVDDVPPGASRTSGHSLHSPANSEDLDEKAKPPVVQQKGRFKVTSENVDLERVITQHCTVPFPSPSPSPSDATLPNVLGQNLFPLVQSVLHANIHQRLEAAHDREKELLNEISDLQWRLICTQEELQKYKTENAQVNF
ncbi:protein kinase superfamily protein [Actinidia rufa]|uniref:Protein kinase superfamily protein n=1 Tax=Actinidia rufa TaxID=165716 RepID=A0A7J0H2L2_9ERIC|nr:protein kinase superfamily protein [Actinidia rufa]